MQNQNNRVPANVAINPPNSAEIARHLGALRRMLNEPRALLTSTTDDLILFLESRGIRRADTERILDEALRVGPAENASDTAHREMPDDSFAILRTKGAAAFSVDGQTVAVIAPKAAHSTTSEST